MADKHLSMCCTSEHQFLATFLGPKHWRGRIASGFTIEFGNAIHPNSLVPRFHEKIGMCCKNRLRIFCKKIMTRIFLTEFLGFIRLSKMEIETFVLWDFHLSNILFLILGTGPSRFLTRLSQFHQLYQRPKKKAMAYSSSWEKRFFLWHWPELEQIVQVFGDTLRQAMGRKRETIRLCSDFSKWMEGILTSFF